MAAVDAGELCANSGNVCGSQEAHLPCCPAGDRTKGGSDSRVGNLLRNTGERKHNCTTKEPEALHEEFTYGKLEITLELPESVNCAKMYAEFENGVLEITAPVAAAALSRKIEIKTIP